MRRHPVLVRAAVAAAAAIVAVVPAAAAYAVDPSPSTSAGPQGSSNIGPATAGTAVCTVAANGPTAISGMVATDKGTFVVESKDEATLRVWTLDGTCKATPKTYSAINPLSPQDIEVASDGALWIGDIGDEDKTRTSIAYHVIPSGGGTPVTNRTTYPASDGPKTAQAFILDGDDVPIVLARGDGAGVGLYKPTKAFVPNAKTGLPAMAKVGEFTPEKTGTSTPTSTVGNQLVTGAAKSPDGKKVVIRTLSDAYEWDVAEDKDVVKAITGGKPRITRLPDEAQGEAISYTADGTKFVTLSAKPTGATENPKMLSYTPFVPSADGGDDPGGGEQPAAPGSDQGWFDKLSFNELTRIVAAVGVVGLVLAVAGIIGIRRARKRRREEEDEYDDYDDDYDDRPRRGGGRRPREDDYAHAGGAYGGGYEDGYGAQAGYGANGYAAEGYDQYGAPAGGYANGQANGYGYGAEQYADQQGGGYDQYAGQGYGDQYGGQQQYGGDYGQQYGQGYPQQYGADQYGGQQQYGGGYGYEEEFDPLDPRRR